MIGRLTQAILEAIRAHGAWSVFTGVLVEQIIIPIPSPVIIMGAGFLLIPAGEPLGPALLRMSHQIVLPGAAASTLGGLLCYYLGLWGGRLFVEKFQRYLGFGWSDVEWMGKKMSVTGEAAALFFLRAAPVVPLSLVSLAAGVLKIPNRTFLVWTFLGSIPRCFLLSWLGWKMGVGAIGLATGVNKLESMISLALAAGIVGMVLYLRRRVRRGMNS
ncbi:MAG: DedA family protein [Elusimicrobiota bacterium]|jgi:membrane protein DedA with SNARE-associated domain